MKAIMVVLVLFGAPDAELGSYEKVYFEYEFDSMELCYAATEQVEKDLLEKENYRGSAIECRSAAR